MNREIKFRAWDESRKEMITEFGRLKESMPELLQNDEYGNIFCGHYQDNGDWIEPVLMQYTGLKDKNGKEIYEGDIVSGKPLMGWSDQSKIIGSVFFQQNLGCWRVIVKKDDWEDIEYLSEIVKNPRHELEVIGNIYENPELLQL